MNTILSKLFDHLNKMKNSLVNGERVLLDEVNAVTAQFRNGLSDSIPNGTAIGIIEHKRPTNWLKDAVTGFLTPDPASYQLVGDIDVSHNLVTLAGRDYLHLQGYGTTGLGANGFNYIALSNDTVTETNASTTLSNEIVLNGLIRTQGSVTHSTSANTSAVQVVFTASGGQSAQKAALFNLASVGVMNHVLAFTQRALINLDTLTITFTITLG